MFIFPRSLHIVFQSGCTSLHSHQQRMRVPFSLHPHQRFLVVVLFMVAILTQVRWNLSVVLIYISFMARDGEHFSCVFWPFGLLPLNKFCLVQLPSSLLVHWFWGSSVFEFHVYSSYQFFVWYIASKDFLPLLGGLFNLETISFVVQKLFTQSSVLLLC
jgi:hypothetical protein